MNLVTHVLAGVLVQIVCFKIFTFPLDFILTVLLTFFTHFLLDGFVNITYHTPDPQKGDKFWLSWQIITYGSGIIAGVIFFSYIIGIIFANLIDIVDWLILRPYHERKKKNKEIDWEKNYFFHNIISKFREKTLFWLPDWKRIKKAVISEIAIIVILFIGIIYLNPKIL